LYDAPAAPAAGAIFKNIMKVRFTKNPIYLRLAHSEGEEAELSDSLAKQLIADGFAVEVKATEAPAKKTAPKKTDKN
jgi:hypothetical protein